MHLLSIDKKKRPAAILAHRPQQRGPAMSTPSIVTMDDVITFARSRNACSAALAWLKTQESAAAAWEACDCARTTLPFVPVGEDRPRLAIETTERWMIGAAAAEEVRADAAAAADAAYAYAAADRKEATVTMCGIVRKHIVFADLSCRRARPA
jgi:hypothetical protein